MILKAILILMLNLVCLAEAGNLRQLDTRITAALEGTNQHPVLDYAIESLALATPAIEWSFVWHWHARAARSGDPSQQQFAQLATVGLLAPQLGVALLKFLVQRKRPNRRYQPRLWNTRITSSFPSGHAVSTAAFASLAAHQYPNARPLLTAYVLASSYSQLYVGNHYAMDVLVGLIFGATISNWLLENLDSGNAIPAVVSIYLPLN